MREVRKEQINAYREYLNDYRKKDGNPICPQWKYQLAGLVCRFFAFLEREERILFNPAESIKLKKPQEELPKDILTEEEVKRILSMPDKRSKNGLRDRTMIEILYGSGLRILELRKLRLCDIDLESGYLFITGKGQKDRVVPMTRTARHYLKRYLEKARPFLLDKEYSTEAVFLNQFGKSFGKNGIGIMIKNYSLKAKIEKNVTPHTFRHSCATHLIYRGASVRYVQELLGHNEINTTQIYTRVMPVDLKRVYEATHPRCLKYE